MTSFTATSCLADNSACCAYEGICLFDKMEADLRIDMDSLFLLLGQLDKGVSGEVKSEGHAATSKVEAEA